MSGYSFPAVVVSLTMVSLGLFVLTRNAMSGVHRALFLQSLCLSLWLFSYGIMYSIQSAEVARSLVNIGYMAVIFIPVTFYHFIFHFLKLYRKRAWLVLAYLVSGLFTLSLWFSTYFVSGMERYLWGFYPKAGIIHPAFMAFFSTLYCSAVRFVFRA